MCGRAYKTYTEEELYFQYLSKRPPNLIDFAPVYNLCPTQNTVVLRFIDGECQFEECSDLNTGSNPVGTPQLPTKSFN